ncbi:hypothetical protein [Niveispirillum lacus]|uniref:hypothetical protein n=1 Tax=Niveispirillum lacus TaxID=1981099 RepID=UPI0013FDE652|nr:hypothetical protein [Niveispirillum lacus]
MEMDDRDQGGGRRVVTTENQTDEQRRQSRQTDCIRDLERMMRGAAAFSRQSGE